ncbi:MAG: bifunctional riboflavin kinase/FAD synthetase [Candidatus Omnitrophota bacterium]|jgi:riboflavin kinase/FMN adenylyltransferase
MNVIYGIGKIKKHFRNAVLTIGVFDGLHIGHQKLIKAAVKTARSLKGPAIVMTFSPHPVQVLSPNTYLPFIVSLPHRLKLFEQLGITTCIMIRFTKKFSHLTSHQFVKKYLTDAIRPKIVYVGRDFRFGQGRQGTLSDFQEIGKSQGFKVCTVALLKAGKMKIGSSHIRQLILEGRLHKAERYLGRKLSAMGRVVKGDGRGKTLGFPTANIRPSNEVILPVGVYAVRVRIGPDSFKGMANIGRRPSFKKKNCPINIETHVFDFSKNIYGKEIIIEFIERLRAEKTFRSAAQMIAQLKRDERKSRAILRVS